VIFDNIKRESKINNQSSSIHSTLTHKFEGQSQKK